MAKNTYPWDRINDLTPQEWTKALRALARAGGITDRQWLILRCHCEAPDHTLTANQLARKAHLKGYRAVNLEYGRLAHRLWEVLGLPSPPEVARPYFQNARWLGVLEGGPWSPPEREWEGAMHPSLVKALKRIGACGKGKGRNGPNDLDPHLSGGLFPPTGAGIGEAEQNALVELAAVNAVTSEYRSRGWRVKSKESEKVGYDLLCRRGSAVHHVEVKGIRGAICSFMITANEKNKAELDPAFSLVAVTKALEPDRRRLSEFTGPDLLRKFHFAPISFMARPR
jgi:Domain of unknown function (DUF3883)